MDVVPCLEVNDRTFAFASAPFLLCIALAMAFSLSTALLEIGPLVTRGAGEGESSIGLWWDGAQLATRLDIFELRVTRTMLVLRIK
jgi:hypothetical protein